MQRLRPWRQFEVARARSNLGVRRLLQSHDVSVQGLFQCEKTETKLWNLEVLKVILASVQQVVLNGSVHAPSASTLHPSLNHLNFSELQGR